MPHRLNSRSLQFLWGTRKVAADAHTFAKLWTCRDHGRGYLVLV